MRNLNENSLSNRLPTEVERDSAIKLYSVLSSQMDSLVLVRLKQSSDRPEYQEVFLAPAIAAVMMKLLKNVADGKGLIIKPIHQELTAREAADLLNVSYFYFLKLLEKGDIPCRKAGRRKLVRAEDLFRYRSVRDQNRALALSKLAEDDASLGLL